MTDDELRKLAEAALADESRRLAPGPAPGRSSSMEAELARAVLRLLEENEILRLKLADVSVDKRIADLMERANDLLAKNGR